MAAAYPALDGVSVEVNHPGPAIVEVTVIGRGLPHRLTQQITKRGSGASFVFLETAPVYSVSVNVWDKSRNGVGVITNCDVPVPGAK